MAVFSTSVTKWQNDIKARNEAQKQDLQYQSIDAVKKLAMAVESIQKQILGLRERIELLESEDHIGGTPYSDGPIK